MNIWLDDNYFYWRAVIFEFILASIFFMDEKNRLKVTKSALLISPCFLRSKRTFLIFLSANA